MPPGYLVDIKKLRGRVLLLNKYNIPDALTGKYYKKNIVNGNKRKPFDLASFIKIAESISLGKKRRHKHIYDLSAVRTNILKVNHRIKRYWYMLPKLRERHLPDLFIPRINGSHPKTMMNKGRRAVVDANFSTIWTDSKSQIDAFAVLAILNSSWIQAAMELSGTVMGGGALKLEAAHIRKLPIPIFAPDQLLLLSELGRKLVKGKRYVGTIAEINKIVAVAIFGNNNIGENLKAIERIKNNMLSIRNGK